MSSVLPFLRLLFHPPYLSLFSLVQHPGLKILRSDSSSSISSRIGWTSLLSVVWNLFILTSAGLSRPRFLFFICFPALWSGIVAACIAHTSDFKVTNIHTCVCVACDVSPPYCCFTLSFVSLCDSHSWMFLLPRYLDFLPLLLSLSLRSSPIHMSTHPSVSLAVFTCTCPGV